MSSTMSRHIFTTTATLADGRSIPVRICIGWDRPLQGYFLDIQDLSSDSDDEDRLLFTNLAEAPGATHPDTLEPFLAKLDELAIALPQGLHAELRADRRNNVGNRVVEHIAESRS